jgi:hypothetical protein
MNHDKAITAFNKVDAAEPLFVLRARDKLAARTLERWLELAKLNGVSAEKIASAEEDLGLFEAFATDNRGEMKLPD